MARINLYLLGPPLIEHGGEPVQLNRRKAMALLTYLAVTGTSHSRDGLATLFWPDYNQRRARAALRSALWAINKTPLGEGLAVEPETIGLKPEADLWLDVAHFRGLLAACQEHDHPPEEVCPTCLSTLTEAADLYRADFLAGFTLPDAPDFDEWQFFQTESLRQELAAVLEGLVKGHSAQGTSEAAIPHARRWLALDPLHEPAHRQLMLLYAQSGQQAAALRQYQVCVDALEAEFGVAPTEETSALYEHIRSGKLSQGAEAQGSRGAGKKSPLHPRSPAPSPDLPPFLADDALPSPEKRLVVARERELGQLDEALNLTLQGQGCIVFVTGEAGRGKTTLMQEFARRAQEQHPDLIVAGGNCEAYTGLGDPYLPFREILILLTGDIEAKARAGAISREQARRLWQASSQTLQTLVANGPDLIGVFVPAARLSQQAQVVAPAGVEWLSQLEQLAAQQANRQGLSALNQVNLFQQVVAVLHSLAQDRPLLLLLDDLQWADMGSIDLLFHLGRRLAESRILVVGAYRPADVDLGRGDNRHPLEPLLNEFQRRFGDHSLDLRQAKGRQLVEAIVDNEPNRLGPAFREALYRHTQGHALFTVETLRAMQARGDLVRDDSGHWVEGPTILWEQLPARVEGVIGERLGRLPANLQETLKVASVLGEAFTAEVVARVLKVEEREIVRQLSGPLEKQHHLVRSQGSQRLNGQRLSHYRFQHNLFQTYLYQNIDEAERGYLHEDAGRELEQLYGELTGEIAAQLARHFREAGLTAKAVDYLQQAGEQAIRLSANAEAIPHLRQALTLLETLPVTVKRNHQELEVQLALGNALFPVKGYAVPEVEQAFVRARELCQFVSDMPRLVSVLKGLKTCYNFQAEHHKAHNLAAEILPIAQRQQDQTALLSAHVELAVTLQVLGEFAAAREHFEQSLVNYDSQQHRIFVQMYGLDQAIHSLGWSAVNLWHLGYPNQALRRSREALIMIQETPHPFSQALGMILAAALHLCRREVQAAQEYLKPLLALSTEYGFSWWLAVGTIRQGWALVRQGQGEAGIAQIREGLNLAQTLSIKLQRPYFLALLADAYWQMGQTVEGLSTVDQALAVAEGTDEREWEAELYRLKGELLLKAKRETINDELSPEACFLKAIAVARRQQAKSLELRAATSLARLWQAQGKIAEARQMLADTYGWFTEGFDTPDLIEAKALLDELSVEAKNAGGQSALWPPKSNLPAQPTPFIGRETELAELANLLADPNTRLLTIVGPGGMGKTRLALAVAEGQLMRSHFSNGVYFVSLAPLSEPEAIIYALAEAVGYPFQRDGRSPQQQLFDYFRQKTALLLLDNFEHLLEGVEFIAKLLRNAPEVKILATSRERLHLYEEQVYPLRGLAAPEGETAASVTGSAAVELFLQSARRSQPNFEVGADDLGHLADICRLVEGMPLALELAASWVDMLSLADILTEIHQSLDFLETELHNMPDRHRSMRAVFDASWQRLTEAEQSIFAQLSVFRGGFTREAAKEVAGTSLRTLATLANKSLLRYSQRRDRYEIHELLRQYGAEKLVGDPVQEKAVHDGHSAYFCAFLDQLEADLKGERQLEALAEIEADHENVHLAWRWAVAQEQLDRLGRAMESLGLFYHSQGRYLEGVAACQLAGEKLAAVGDRPRILAKTLTWQSLFSQQLGRGDLAKDLLEQSLALLDRPELAAQDTRSERAFALLHRGRLSWYADVEEARLLLEESLVLYRATGDRWGTARVLRELGRLKMGLGAYQEAKQFVAESLTLQRALGDRSGMAQSLEQLTYIANFQGQLAEAERFAREGYAIFRDIGDPASIAEGLLPVGLALLWRGQFVEAQALFEQASAIIKELGDRGHLYTANLWLAAANLHLGLYRQAQVWGQRNLTMAQEIGLRSSRGRALLQLGQVKVVEGIYAEARQLLAESITIYRETGRLELLGWALPFLGYADRGLDNLPLAQQHLAEALRMVANSGNFLALIGALPLAALLWADRSEVERAVELYALARRYPHVANSRWYEDVAGRQIAAAAETLPPEVVASAQERGRARDAAATVVELSAELEEAWAS